MSTIEIPHVNVQYLRSAMTTEAELATPPTVALAQVEPSIPYAELDFTAGNWTDWVEDPLTGLWTGKFRWLYLGDADPAVYLFLSKITNGAETVILTHGVVQLT